MAKKTFAQYRQEAEQLNEQAKNQGQPELIPDFAELRLRPLAKKVIQARLDINRGGGRVES